MIIMHQFANPPHHFNLSPFCLKLEAFLRLAKLPYQVVNQDNPGDAPKGQLPYIEIDGQKIADSAIIIRHLSKAYEIDLDAGLTRQQRAMSHAIRIMIEERLYFAMKWARWADADRWPQTKQVFFAELPIEQRDAIADGFQQQVKHALYNQGIAHHTPEEIAQFAEEDLDSIAALLADKPYLFGEQACLTDITLFAFTANLLTGLVPSRLTALAAAYPNLVGHRDRMMARLFPEFAIMG